VLNELVVVMLELNSYR